MTSRKSRLTRKHIVIAAFSLFITALAVTCVLVVIRIYTDSNLQALKVIEYRYSIILLSNAHKTITYDNRAGCLIELCVCGRIIRQPHSCVKFRVNVISLHHRKVAVSHVSQFMVKVACGCFLFTTNEPPLSYQ